MTRSLVDEIAQAVLNEGYILYPYRASSRKNHQRFTFGRVYPQAYSRAQEGAEPFAAQTQCLVRAGAGSPTIEVRVRFLQPTLREVNQLAAPLPEWGKAKAALSPLPELSVDGQLYQTWHEAAEREIRLDGRPITEAGWTVPFSFGGEERIEPITRMDGTVVAAIRREFAALQGCVEARQQSVDDEVSMLTVRIENHTPVAERALQDADAILLRTFASAHIILHVTDGEFLSLLEPPAKYAAAAAACQNIGTWPVLVGDEQQHDRDTMLASPIILYDYPRLAPESPGDLCDGTEIDEILSLRIQTMTDQEKAEATQVDSFARAILERTERLSPTQFAGLHGTMRPVSSFEEQLFGQVAKLEQVNVGGVVLRAGDRVRIRPKGRADVMDLALANKTAVIEAVEQDAEKRVHLALVVDDDPGKDLGFLRQPGHRFFYAPEEVEPLVEGTS